MWQWVKACKGVALVAFFLPWMTVSCSGTELIRASGWDLAIGHPRLSPALADLAKRTAAASQQAGDHPSVLLILALVSVLIGLAFAFRPAASGAKAVIATAAAAIVLTAVATHNISNAAMAKAMAQTKHAGSGTDLGAMAAAAIRIDWQFAYWLFLGALVAAAVLSWMTLTGRPRAPGTFPSA